MGSLIMLQHNIYQKEKKKYKYRKEHLHLVWFISTHAKRQSCHSTSDILPLPSWETVYPYTEPPSYQQELHITKTTVVGKRNKFFPRIHTRIHNKLTYRKHKPLIENILLTMAKFIGPFAFVVCAFKHLADG